MIPHPDMLVLEDMLSAEKCKEFLAFVSKHQRHFEEAGTLTADGAKVTKEHRDTLTMNIASLSTFKDWNNYLFQEIGKGIAAYVKHMDLPRLKAKLVPEGLQLLKYVPGGFYSRHIDGWLGSEYRQISVILYLNDDFEDGEIEFPRQQLKLKPKPGMLVLFPSNFCFPHAALPPKNGTRFALVTWYTVR